jgi:hypothetical protein
MVELRVSVLGILRVIHECFLELLEAHHELLIWACYPSHALNHAGIAGCVISLSISPWRRSGWATT